MSWDEFVTLLSGINGDTPLGRIVSIRAEKNPETIRNFTKEEMRIHNRWKHRQVKDISKEEYDKAMEGFEKMFKSIGQSK